MELGGQFTTVSLSMTWNGFRELEIIKLQVALESNGRPNSVLSDDHLVYQDFDARCRH